MVGECEFSYQKKVAECRKLLKYFKFRKRNQKVQGFVIYSTVVNLICLKNLLNVQNFSTFLSFPVFLIRHNNDNLSHIRTYYNKGSNPKSIIKLLLNKLNKFS